MYNLKLDKFCFGDVDLSTEETAFYKLLNHQLYTMCLELPYVLHNPAALFFMRYSRNPADPMDFFSDYHIASWSILPSLFMGSAGTQIDENMKHKAVMGHAMALMLHALDNHLVDGQIKTSHLLLQVRSQAWMNFIQSAHLFTGDISERIEFINSTINDYYNSVNNRTHIDDFEEYLDVSRKEGATWLIIPYLIALIISKNKQTAHAVNLSQDAFWTAFRLIDDIQDFIDDVRAGKNTTLRLSLANEGRILWDSCKGSTGQNKPDFINLVEYIKDNQIIKKIAARIDKEMRNGARLAKDAGLDSYSSHLNSMNKPIEKLLSENILQ